MSDIPNEITHDQYAVRLKKLQDLRAAGCDPFRASFEPTHFSAEAIKLYVDGQDNAVPVRVAGRLLVMRDMGKSQFVKILDQQGLIQLYLKKDVLGDEVYAAFKKLDLGDIIGAEGTLFKTKTGEITVRVERYVLVAKALRPLPEKWHGLTDPEQVYRQRYLDLIVNEESRRRLLLRSRIVSAIRRFLEDRQFIEVETPVLQSVAGGAAAKPFTTHHNALGCDFFLRISLELHLKRLLVGGWDRVFEIGRNFRNEGLSRKHNPEFTMLEVYQAYSRPPRHDGPHQGSAHDALPRRARHLRDQARGQRPGDQLRRRMARGEVQGPGHRRDRRPAVVRAAARRRRPPAAEKLGLKIEPDWEDFEITNEIFSKRIEPKLVQPTFVLNLPRELCPLAKINREDPSTLDVFELIIGGMEIAPAYSEQNDPFVQREMFEHQAGGEKQNIDEDFLLALEHGMPPAGGMGVGIDRLCILLTGAESIRDVILFPQLRPDA